MLSPVRHDGSMPLSGLPLPVLVVCALGTWALATRHVVAAAQGPQWVSWSATVAGPVVAVILGLAIPAALLPVRDILAGWLGVCLGVDVVGHRRRTESASAARAVTQRPIARTTSSAAVRRSLTSSRRRERCVAIGVTRPHKHVTGHPDLPHSVCGSAPEPLFGRQLPLRMRAWEHFRMSDGPLLRATSESGDTISDPSEDALFMMFEDIEAGESTFLIIDSLRDSTSQTYAQTSRNEDGTYIVEYRDGGPENHYGTVAKNMRAAHALITGWAFGLPGWRDSATWERVSI